MGRSWVKTEQTYYRWRREYNTLRPHSFLGYIPPPPEAGNAGLT
ncbi:MAG: integrase core domain-containing protein [Planctomycetota bacterium]